MAMKDVDFLAGMRRLADRRIEEAMSQGKFDNLQGAGQDIVLDDMPANEDARMRWWALRILRQNDFTPDEVRWRKQIDLLKESLERAKAESQLTLLVEQINRLVYQVNTLGTNALIAPVVPLALDDELAKMRARIKG